ncbi:phosphotransferase [Actinoplanes derwentensis]|uniref:Predicted kinase, aminoglycoside phosphotransferase (APT) family n=1 Tax=Actinoplanes derwentensis TaxID=113562 RepID=A0A1H1W9Z8_9ACTN|nr:phosphotransferase [Actinoplanes derwentensis]GID84078.1 phosphotransferase [Actinoplanes derwentensis]SDS92999.1 Predicted kinase, aminoglycoside phosphotransferase (APT) family [Actinoplanes derwentensis]
MTVHDGEIAIGEPLVRELLGEQCPQWAGLPLRQAGAGTENVMFRLGDGLLVRLPRTTDRSGALRKEVRWLPRLAARLSSRIPAVSYVGTPTASYPADWAVFGWIDGAEAGPSTVGDWAVFGADLAGFVRELHTVPLDGAERGGDLSWYRGGHLAPCDEWVGRALAECRPLIGGSQVDALARVWRAGLALPESGARHVWLHGDLKPTNLLVTGRRLGAVIDFGALSVGLPDAEHATVWDLPGAAREAYRSGLGLDEVTWMRARAWAVAVAVSGIAYYWATFPEFVAECRARVAFILES